MLHGECAGLARARFPRSGLPSHRAEAQLLARPLGKPETGPDAGVIRRPEARDSVPLLLAQDSGGHSSEAVSCQDVVDPAVERPPNLAQVIAVAAGKPDVMWTRLGPRIVEARGKKVRARGCPAAVGARVEIAEENCGNGGAETGVGREFLALRDLGRVVEGLEVRRDHPEATSGDRRIREYPATLGDDEAAEERSGRRVLPPGYAQDFDLTV